MSTKPPGAQRHHLAFFVLAALTVVPAIGWARHPKPAPRLTRALLDASRLRSLLPVAPPSQPLPLSSAKPAPKAPSPWRLSASASASAVPEPPQRFQLTGPASLLAPRPREAATRLARPAPRLRAPSLGERVVELLSLKPEAAPLSPPPLSLPPLQISIPLPTPVTAPAPALPSMPLPEVPAGATARPAGSFREAAQRWVMQDRRKTLAPAGIPFPLEIKASSVSAALTLKGRF